MYSLLSTSGAHPRFDSLFGYNAFEQPENILTSQPWYDEELIEQIMSYIKTGLRMMVRTVLELSSDGTELAQPELNWRMEDIKEVRDFLGVKVDLPE